MEILKFNEDKIRKTISYLKKADKKVKESKNKITSATIP